MGGHGSGRRPTSSGKATTEDSTPLDVRRLAKAGALAPGRVVSWQWTINDRVHSTIQIRAERGLVTLSYSNRPRGGSPDAISQLVDVVATPGTLGGQRSWFACPGCRTRVAVIYGAGQLFACRQCKGLAYTSQSEQADDRAARRANRIRKRLCWPVGIFNPCREKPKGMHWQTYWRLRAKHDRLVMVSLEGMSQRLGTMKQSLNAIDRRMAERR